MRLSMHAVLLGGMLSGAVVSVSSNALAARERPDPQITPGAINTQVNPQNIDATVCQKGWSRTVRPPVIRRSPQVEGVATS